MDTKRLAYTSLFVVSTVSVGEISVIFEIENLKEFHVFFCREFFAVMASELDFSELVFLYSELGHHPFCICYAFRVETFHNAFNVIWSFNNVFVDDFEIFDFNE